jgi:hypothetical protein
VYDLFTQDLRARVYSKLKEIPSAEEANELGRFTAFIGYEWTSNTGGNNLHRNVIFRDRKITARSPLVESEYAHEDFQWWTAAMAQLSIQCQ